MVAWVRLAGEHGSCAEISWRRVSMASPQWETMTRSRAGSIQVSLMTFARCSDRGCGR